MGVEELGYSQADEHGLKGGISVGFIKGDSKDIGKILLDFAKETPALVIKGAMIDKEFLDADKVEAYSKLPGRNQLIAMLMSTMQAPAQNLVYVINAIPTKLVRVLKAIEEKKAKEEAL